jgi:hypothetical protein
MTLRQYSRYRVFGLAVLTVMAQASASAARADGIALHSNYGVYWANPKSPDYGPGGVLLGYFDSTGKELHIEQLICRPLQIPTEDEQKRCINNQPSLSSTHKDEFKLDITAIIKALVGLGLSGSYVKSASLKITNGCMFEMSLEEQMASLENRKACLKTVKSVNSGLSKASLSEKIKNPGKYLLIFQSTRGLYGNAEFEVVFNAGLSFNAKTEAAQTIAGISGSAALSAVTGDTVTIKGEKIFVGLQPRYYEQWFLDEKASKVVGVKMQELIEKRSLLMSDDVKADVKGKVAPSVEIVDRARIAVDNRIDEVIGRGE